MNTIDFFVFPKTLRRMHQGSLGAYIDEFAAILHDQGYSRTWACDMIRVVADFSRRLYGRHFGAEDVDADRLKRFLAHRKRTRNRTNSDAEEAKKRQILDKNESEENGRRKGTFYAPGFSPLSQRP